MVSFNSLGQFEAWDNDRMNHDYRHPQQNLEAQQYHPALGLLVRLGCPVGQMARFSRVCRQCRYVHPNQASQGGQVVPVVPLAQKS